MLKDEIMTHKICENLLEKGEKLKPKIKNEIIHELAIVYILCKETCHFTPEQYKKTTNKKSDDIITEVNQNSK